MGRGRLTCDNYPLAVGSFLLQLVALRQLVLGAHEPPGGLLGGIQHPVGVEVAALLLLAHLFPP